jgi:excinuclease ABC subunit C
VSPVPESAREALSEKIASLPTTAGVYLLKDGSGRVLYVGKATSLRSRVRSYLSKGALERPHLAPYLRRWRDVDVVATKNAAEALVLENSFIKMERPPANVRLRDDKRYLCLRLDLSHEYPRITLVRRFKNDGATYFGPYADAKALRNTLKALREIYPLRTCSDRTLATIAAPCLYYQLGRCAAPCHDLISREDYAGLVDETVELLRGRKPEALVSLRGRMEEEAAELRFENAARLRDRLRALERTLEQQRVAAPDRVDRDVVAIARTGDGVSDTAVAQILFVRDGAVVSVRTVPLPGAAGDLPNVLEAFVVQFYDQRKYVPKEVLVEALPEEQELVEEYLSLLRGAQVRLRVPQRGGGRKLMELAKRNADVSLKAHRRDRNAAAEALEGLAAALHLPDPPAVIECFDVSHLQGREVVASMVRFVDGRPERDAWRHYRLRSVNRNDDFAAMNEILSRRYREAADGGTAARPDLIVVDGGKGQLSSARAALESLGMPDPPVVGLAKARAGKHGEGAFERVFVPGRSEPVIPRQDSPETLLLARIRDEAHRFAITYHRKLRSKMAVESALDRIEGVGDKWRRELLTRFGSVAAVREAGVEDLTQIPGLGRKRAMRILEHLKADEQDG